MSDEREGRMTALDCAIDAAIGGIGGAAAPADLRRRVLARIGEKERPSARAFPLLAGAAAVLAVVALAVALRPGRGPAPVPTPVPATAKQVASGPIAGRVEPALLARQRQLPQPVTWGSVPSLDRLPASEPVETAPLSEPELRLPEVEFNALAIEPLAVEPLGEP